MTEATTRFHVTYADRPVGTVALVTIDDGADHRRPTTFGAAALESLEAALDALESSRPAGVLVTGKPYVFAAGADLEEFAAASTPEAARAAARRGQELFTRLAALPGTTLAAVNGVCLGGGLELALHCDVRTVSASARGVGFPEVFLSIVPAWGGTQLATRLVGARRAVEVVVANPLADNRLLSPQQAHEAGLVDRLLDPACFLDDSLALLEALIANPDHELHRRSSPEPDGDLDGLLSGAQAEADERTGGATRAPALALELIGFAARGGDLDEGRRREQEALAELLPARQAQASVYAFDLTQRRARRQPGRPDVPPRPIRRAGVIGAGLMGAQLAALHVRRLELPLVVHDVDADALDRARASLEEQLRRRVDRGRLTPGRARFLQELVTFTTDPAELADADWVVEAVAERADVKREVLGGLEDHLADEAVVATNTSALSVGDLAAGMRRGERLVGLHFFHPVAAMPLVEVVRPSTAGDVAVATAFEQARRLGKTAVGCADGPGFVVNRLLLRFNGEAIRALRDGASPRRIEEAVRGLGLPMGPFTLFSLVGRDVALGTSRHLAATLGPRFALGEDLEAVVGQDLGRLLSRDVTASELGFAGSDTGTAPGADAIRSRALAAVADECGRMLADGVVADPRDLDTAMLLGAGWPFFTGGVCFLLDAEGVSERVLGRRLLEAH